MGNLIPREDTQILSKEEVETKEPSMYKVVLLNDNYTSMEFVVMVLEAVFQKPREEAETIMLSVHEKGAGTAGIYTREIAETKIMTVQHLARQNDFPLRCTMEPV